MVKINRCNINEIKALLSAHGFHFSKSMGQNFLIDSSVPERIVAESGIDSSSGVLEIGPGIGALTEPLSRAAGKVVSVELDKKLLPILNELAAEHTNLEIVSGDILKLDLTELVETKLAPFRPAVCANLPYNITTPVLSALIDTGLFETITVMIQREVAHRLAAKAGTADYGAFTVYTNFYTRPEILFDVPPSCFTPQPKVYSSVVTLHRRGTPPADVNDINMFFKVVRASFAQRRKTLVNGLSSVFSPSIPKETLTDIIRYCGYDEKIRGEALDICDFARISNELCKL